MKVTTFKLPNIGGLSEEPFKVEVPLIERGGNGPKVIYISEEEPDEDDIENGKYLSGEQGTIVNNALKQASLFAKVVPSKELFLYIPPCHSKTDQDSDMSLAFDRIQDLVERFEPDVIVLFGFKDARRYINTKSGKNLSPEHVKEFRGRIIRLKHLGRLKKVKILFTLPFSSFASLNPKRFSSEVNLIGFAIRDVEIAYLGKNLYTLPDIDKKKLHLIDNIEDYRKFYKKLVTAKYVSIDTEGKNLNRVYGNVLYCVLFCMDGKNVYMVPYMHPKSPFMPNELREIQETLKHYFEFGESIFHIYQNAKFDLLMFFSQLKIEFYNHKLYDLMVGEMNLDENRKFLKTLIKSTYSLKYITANRGGSRGYENTAISKDQRHNMAAFSLEEILEYGALDVFNPYHLAQFQIKEAKRRGPAYKGFLKAVTNIGSDKLLSFVEMERFGLPVDKDYIVSQMAPESAINKERQKYVDTLLNLPSVKKANEILCKQRGIPTKAIGLLSGTAGSPMVFSPRKEDHIQLLFFDVCAIQPLAKNAKGGGKTDKAFLSEYKDKFKEVEIVSEIRNLNVLANTYIKGLLKTLVSSEDNKDMRLRATYDFIRIITGRSGACLTAETPIYVLDERRIVPIKDIKAGDWVWSFDSKLNPVATQVKKAWRTKKAKTVTVVYQGGNGTSGDITGSQKIIRCTDDHRFRLRDGKYKKAKDLKPGDRVLAIERRVSASGYSYMSWTGMLNGDAKAIANKRPWEHRVAAKCDDPEFIVHHKNRNKLDNRPLNLEVMTQEQHKEHHARDENILASTREKHRQITLARMAKGFKPPTAGVGEGHVNWIHLNKKETIKLLWKAAGRVNKLADALGCDRSILYNKLKYYGIDHRKISKYFDGDNKKITKKRIEEARKMNSYCKAAKHLRVSYYKAKELLESDYNHVITAVYSNGDKEEWVYDLEIPKHHNFIANGVCVHNSNPSLQNIPTHGRLAKIIKRIFRANHGLIMVKTDMSSHEVRLWGMLARDPAMARAFGVKFKALRELRVLLADNQKLDYEFNKFLEDSDWDNIKEADAKRALIKRQSNNPDLKRALECQLAFEAADLHRVNYSFLYKTDPLDVTKVQRSGFKAVVFGAIYERSARTLAITDMFKKEIRPFFLKFVKRTINSEDQEYIWEQTKKFNKEIEPYVEKAQALTDVMFNYFKKGSNWLTKVKEEVSTKYHTVSIFGNVRHLWGMLHTNRSVQNKSIRRGPNSRVQGAASDCVYSGSRLFRECIWYVKVKSGIDLGVKQCNAVHDSSELETSILMLPLILYYLEHSYTTLVHKRLKETFGFDPYIGLETDTEIGPHLGKMGTFNGSEANLLKLVAQSIDWQIENLGYDLKRDALLKGVRHNWRIVNKYWSKEMKDCLKHEHHKPNYTMLIQPEMVKDLNLITKV